MDARQRQRNRHSGLENTKAHNLLEINGVQAQLSVNEKAHKRKSNRHTLLSNTSPKYESMKENKNALC
jgi:hypothetical protein